MEYQDIKVGDEVLRFPAGMSDEEIKGIIDQQMGTAERPAEELRQPSEEMEEWWEDPIMSARMVLDGMTLGWADEIGSHIATGALMLTQPELTAGKSYGDVYNEVHGNVAEEQKAFEQAHPTASTALKVAGGIAAPVPMGKLAGAVGATSKVGRLGAATAEGAAVGAAYGAGTANEGNRLEAAGTGAAFGAGGSLAMAGISKLGGGVINQLSKRRIDEDLVKPGGAFKPITLAETSGDEGGKIVQGLYKDIFGQTLITGRKFRDSEQAFINTARNLLSSADDRLATAKADADDALRGIRDEKKFVQAPAIKEKFIELREAAKAGVKEAKENFNTMSATIKGTALKSATQQVDDAVNAQSSAWREGIYAAAMPKSVTTEQAKRILSTNDPLAVVGRMEQSWAKNGFKSIKDHSFRFDVDDVANRMAAKFKKGDGNVYNTKDIRVMAEEILETAMEGKKGGWLPGTTISNMRSSFGGKANTMNETREGILRQGLLKELKGVIDDDIIIPQLSKLKDGGKAVSAFKGDKDAWGSLVTLRTAVDKAVGSKKQGFFEPDDWISALQRNNKFMTRKGAGKFQRDAYNLAGKMKARDKYIEKTAQRVVNDQMKGRQKDLVNKQKDLQKRMAEIRKQEREAMRGLNTRTLGAEKGVKNNSELNRLQTESAALKSTIDRLQLMASSGTGKGGSLFKELAATGTLAAISGVAGAGLWGAIPVGMLLGKLATTKTGQLAFAGQTGTQQAIQRGMQATNGAVTQQAAKMGAIAPGMAPPPGEQMGGIRDPMKEAGY